MTKNNELQQLQQVRDALEEAFKVHGGCQAVFLKLGLNIDKVGASKVQIEAALDILDRMIETPVPQDILVNTRATQPIDVEKLKKPQYQLCRGILSDDAQTKFELGKKYGWNEAIDHLAAAGYLRAPLEKIEGLEELIKKLDERSKGGGVHRLERNETHILSLSAHAYQKASGG